MRKKMIQILSVPIYPHEQANPTEVVADYLLDNDVVPVVRCKDCKHMKIDRNGYRWCLVWTGINCMGDDGFCNYGERKDNEKYDGK